MESPSKNNDGVKENIVDISKLTLPSFYNTFSNKEITTLSPNEVISKHAALTFVDTIKSVKSIESINANIVIDVIK